ncbi:MAG: shikimate kinase [Fibrobacteres bacterium]|nr:shikimate kinase [Fibrobacterota bacterium]
MKSIVLIGMPGSGKSTVGVLLAKQLRRDFVDTDLVIQVATGRGLQEILDTEGIPGFLAVEEDSILGFAPQGRIVATGGSVVYSEAAMDHLSQNAVVVYLQCQLESLERRLRNLDSRGVVRRAGQSVRDLLAEREPLYKRWAQITIDNSHDDHNKVVNGILRELESFPIA